MIVVVLLGGAAGYGATKFLVPEYQVAANIMIETGGGQMGGGQLLAASGWQDLLRSFAIADPVVNQLGLFVQPARAADTIHVIDVVRAQREHGEEPSQLRGEELYREVYAGLGAADGCAATISLADLATKEG